MEKTTKKLLLAYALAAVGGVLLHFLYQWLPNPVLALISPVRESVWEHVKLLYFPLLAVSLILGRGKGLGRAPWLLGTVAACAVLYTGLLFATRDRLLLGYLRDFRFRMACRLHR